MPCQGPWARRQQDSRVLVTLHRVHVRPKAFRKHGHAPRHEVQAMEKMLARFLVVGFLPVPLPAQGPARGNKERTACHPLVQSEKEQTLKQDTASLK